MNTSWRTALEMFLKPWLATPEVIGVLVCGSYVTGHPSPFSDIDVHLVLAASVGWRERGNRYVDGYLMEYFANPVRQIQQYFQEDYEDNRTMAATQFLTGEILSDPQGVVQQVQREAEQWLAKPFQPLSESQLALSKYGLWDQLENLHEAHVEQRAEFTGLVSHFLYQMVVFYTRYLRYPKPSVHQVYLLWRPDLAEQKYRQPPFPDPVFAELVKDAMFQSPTYDQIEALYQYVMQQTGGFEIDGWTFRSPVTASDI